MISLHFFCCVGQRVQRVLRGLLSSALCGFGPWCHAFAGLYHGTDKKAGKKPLIPDAFHHLHRLSQRVCDAKFCRDRLSSKLAWGAEVQGQVGLWVRQSFSVQCCSCHLSYVSFLFESLTWQVQKISIVWIVWGCSVIQFQPQPFGTGMKKSICANVLLLQWIPYHVRVHPLSHLLAQEMPLSRI